MPDSIVLDSSAVLAVFYREPGQDRVLDVLSVASISTVNLAEVHTKLVNNGAAPKFAWDRLQSLSLSIEGFDAAQAQIVGELVLKTRPLGLSLGDRACLALGLQRKAQVYTTDRTWANLSLGIKIEVIR